MGEPLEQVYLDVFGGQVVLTESVQAVILAKHPEVSEFIGLVGSVLQSPDEVRRSVSDARVVLYYRYAEEVLDGKWIVVVIKRADRNFVSTIYATDRIKAGDVLWKK